MANNSILEVATLNITSGRNAEFEHAFKLAEPIISAISGYIRHELHHCIENSQQYILLVWWETLEAHTIGFRQSESYKQWKELLHHFYDPFPIVLHYSFLNYTSGV